MIQLRVFKMTKWLMVWVSTFTMLMAPVAQGAQASHEATQVSKQQMQAYIDQLGLNRQITLGEFYKRNKDLFPPRIQKQVEPMFMANKNMLMPTIEVTSSKNTLGEEVPGLRVSQNGELINMQWFGESEKLVKIQSTNLSQVDVVNFDDMFLRLLAGDEKFRKQAEPAPRAGDKYRMIKYPAVSEAEWKSMSAMDKASYVVNMRDMWREARKINMLRQMENKKSSSGKKSSSFDFLEKNYFFTQLFFGSEVMAKAPIREEIPDDQTCIVAGYVSKYTAGKGGGKICSVQSINAVYGDKKNQIYQTAKDQCSAQGDGQIACNPYIYGADSNGHAYCITPGQDTDFQRATAWEGGCDRQAKLTEKPLHIVDDETNNKDRYGNGNLRSDIRDQALADQRANNFQQTKDYLLGVLKLAKVVDSGATAATVFDGPISENVFNQVVNFTKADFESEISAATASCAAESEKSGKSNRSHEKNYWAACDQLHARYLFVAEIFQDKCKAPEQKFNQSNMKCDCTAPNVAAVLPGAQCGTAPAPAPTPAKPEVAPAPPAKPEVAPPAKPETAPPAVAERPPKESKGGSSLFDKIWSGVKFVAPFVLAGGIAYLLLKLMTPKKATQTPAADLCPGTSTPPPCVQQCPAPLAPNGSGSCTCPACPPGQVGNVVCVCSSVTVNPTPPVASYTCPDAVTRVSDLSTCPTYPCWNGSSYQNPMNCPTQTSTPAPSRTTTPSAPSTGSSSSGR